MPLPSALLAAASLLLTALSATTSPLPLPVPQPQTYGCASPSPTVNLVVATSGGTRPAWDRLAPAFAAQTGFNITTVYGASLGATATAIPQRLARGEPLDVVIMVDSSAAALSLPPPASNGTAAGNSSPLLAGSTRRVLADSPIAAAVASGSTFRPDVTTVAGLTAGLLAATSVAYSDSASGVYLSTVLFPKLGVSGRLNATGRMIPGTPVGLELVSGRSELGFQQQSELMAVAGVDILGRIAEEVQSITQYSATVVAYSKNPEAAKSLIDFLFTDLARSVMTETGLYPVF